MIHERILGREERPNRAAVERALCEIRFNRQRATAFGADLFGDPVWNLLLELFVHRAAGLDAEEDMISARTTPRYIALMETRGMVRRGKRADSLTLTDKTFDAMEALLAT